MKRKGFPVLILILMMFILSMLGSESKINEVKASSTIYIRVDGSIEGTTDIYTVDNVTYTFTDNIYNEIVVERNNIVIDGANYTTHGSGDTNSVGINLTDRSNITIKNLEVKQFDYGIYLYWSNNNTVIANTVLNNQFGICLHWSDRNTVISNNVFTNLTGICLWWANNNTVIGNNALNSSLGLIHCHSNTIFHNNFRSVGTWMMYYPENTNTWDNGGEGNFWEDYNGVDVNQNGIGDDPYMIALTNQDNYPLMGRFSSFNTSLGEYVEVISNASIEDSTYLEFNHTIKMHISNMTKNQTNGFVRICIPHALMTEPYNVTVNGVNPTYWNYSLHDNGTHRWIYFAYAHSTLEIIIVPEFPSFIMLPFLMMIMLLGVVVCKRKRLMFS